MSNASMMEQMFTAGLEAKRENNSPFGRALAMSVTTESLQGLHPITDTSAESIDKTARIKSAWSGTVDDNGVVQGRDDEAVKALNEVMAAQAALATATKTVVEKATAK